ncbi:hypothetical protein [Nannocystis punicea]|uniref:Uncharacterized protein n=1 Tax=Nannocystis punicea TaxID=2995304 RepID=A0ABY7GV15_9BACT|nr:hypothetical protein [Nannocystis poenicansa]WAS90807.1 hypothetical protein O0S08_31855 [Nannocystis poenicansa]
MLRKILMLCPAVAFALPILAAAPSMARPLAIPAHPAEWCWGGDQFECGLDQQDVLLAVCVQTQIFVQTGSNRAYDCDTLTGPTCLASCDNTADDTATCRSQCDGEGAMFCAPSEKARWGDWGPGIGPWGGWGQGIGPWGGWGQGIGDRDDSDLDDDAIFIDTQTCLELNVNEV